MASENFVQPAIPRFDGHYDHWSMLMENFLRSKEYWQVVSTGITEPPAGVVLTDAQKIELEGQRLKDLKAKNYLFQVIDRSILETILNKDSSKQIWDSLKKKYQGTARAKRVHLQTLRAEFESLRMKMGESVSAYFARTMAIANKRRIHGEQLEDVIIIEKILRSLTAKFNYIVCAIEESRDIDTLSIDELESTLLVHEQKVIRQDKEEQALQVAANLKPTRGGKGGWKGKNGQNRSEEKVDDCQGKGKDYDGQNSTGHKPKSKDKSNVKCFRCQKYGHYRSECRTNLNKNRGEKSNFTENKEEEISLLMACHTKEESHQNLWYLDTGCSNHMCGDKSAFSDLDETFRNTVKFGDDSTVSVMGKGRVAIQTKESSHSISNVLFVPELKTNLLSVGQLQEKGYEISIKEGVCRIHDEKLGLIAQVKMTANRMFPFFGGLKTLQQKNMVVGLPQFEQPSQLCEECIVSKQHRDNFPKGKSRRAKKVLELVHSDLCGLIKPTSNGGKRYFISFIDDFSRKTWVYFLQEKSEAFTAFQMFKALVEREADSQIKILRTDRGGEFNSQEFGSFCENHGIRRQLTAAYTPQQNGVCERKNRTILNMVRSLLQMSGLSKSFWPEAVVWSVYILNRSPTIAVQNITPEEAWSGCKPAVDHFRPSTVSAPDLPQNRVSAETPPATNELDEQVEATDSRSQHDRRRPAWMSDYEVTGFNTLENPLIHFTLFSECDPTTFKEAVKEQKWLKAMDEEIASIEKNNTWELTELPMGQRTIGVKWVYKTKLKENGEIDKYKARLVAKGYKQEFGVDYKEVFAPVARLKTIRLIIALAAQNSWPVFQLDVKSTFLHGELQEEVFIEQPPGYVKLGSEHKVYKLKKALYGLKQAPRAWYSHIDAYFLKEGFRKCPYEHTLYTKIGDDGKMLMVCLYVDDLIYTGNDRVMFEKFKKSIMLEFDMTDLGLLHYFLGLEVIQSDAGNFICQKKYVEEILERFQMKNCNSVTTPIEKGLKLVKDPAGRIVDSTLYKQIVGSLMYLTATRPDIMHAVSSISRYMERPKEDHLLAVKRILRYLRGTAEFGLFYKKGKKSYLYGFADSDYAGDLDDRRSTSGYVFMFGSAAISWSSKKQPIVTLSTTEAEFVAAASCACQALWLRNILHELQFKQPESTQIFCDNSSTIKLSKNPVLHGKCKHIDVRYHFLRDLTKNEVIDLVYCRSEDQVADIFTKPLKLASFFKLRKSLGVCKLQFEEDSAECLN
ncbi:hypothetical protein KPL71_017659 [Citrus sinensis]|uniref:Uncharacterized protein n=1 Tax=Citrus sinensis TaxID=2711 RepID=A0ACB8JQQ2_CITSI|nr:hypothetical protein KPL71_017659 [Citrus sinensis]